MALNGVLRHGQEQQQVSEYVARFQCMLQGYVLGVPEVFEEMLQVFHVNVAKLDLRVADVVFECCECYF
jgi:hypothetical protein